MQLAAITEVVSLGVTRAAVLDWDSVVYGFEDTSVSPGTWVFQSNGGATTRTVETAAAIAAAVGVPLLTIGGPSGSPNQLIQITEVIGTGPATRAAVIFYPDFVGALEDTTTSPDTWVLTQVGVPTPIRTTDTPEDIAAVVGVVLAVPNSVVATPRSPIQVTQDLGGANTQERVLFWQQIQLTPAPYEESTGGPWVFEVAGLGEIKTVQSFAAIAASVGFVVN